MILFSDLHRIKCAPSGSTCELPKATVTSQLLTIRHSPKDRSKFRGNVACMPDMPASFLKPAQ